ncbi:AAA family ATPase [Methylomonas rosea]|uniref:AAA family ATPase n=1 Tax=Methylomonas rosea TaxID=2952227 RepID=A0ABT1TTA7_9GAMM|nr:AAA family ATPase [Methylomonas sp. WSC-7]MCQ8118009.1 AAA family ATPase [Methylomonas sp. WSC-7]
MIFSCTINNVQHIKELAFFVELNNQIMCIVGKNGTGKTTLIRAIKNLSVTDTFAKTAAPYIFFSDSQISYQYNDKNYVFRYNEKLRTIDTKDIIDKAVKNNIYVELPIPHGERFGNFQKLGDIDEELRRKIALKEYETPNELIAFLSEIYQTDRFENLKEVSIKKSKYYFILREGNFYIREDYLSSGEHFVINLYKMVQRRCKLIFIDEIDISLDASAQVNLLNELRKFCREYEVNIIFTTHSLALMKKLNDSELYYMESSNGIVTIREASYNYVKSLLFGFKGWDRYILTEDEMLQNYIEHLIVHENISAHYTYKIIYIGGANRVVDLMNRNSEDEFLSKKENVITVLDGDQKINRSYQDNEKIVFIPFSSVEKQLFENFTNNDVPETFIFTKTPENPKELYKSIRQQSYMSDAEIFLFINRQKQTEVNDFARILSNFLNPQA